MTCWHLSFSSLSQFNIMSSTEHLLIRTYNPFNSADRNAVQAITSETWPDLPKIYSNEGFIIEDTTSTKPTIIGFILYQYIKPEQLHTDTPLFSSRQNVDEHDWWDIDFKKHFNSFMKSLKTSTNDDNTPNKYIYDEHKTEDEHLRCMQLNPHLQDISNWNRLASHIIHITDVALLHTFRGRGIGSNFLQTFIYSFPRGTCFGLEVEANNHMAINCYQKCGFIIERNVIDYYAVGKAGLKMTLISSYNDEDITRFILAADKQNYTHKHKNGGIKNDQRMAKYTVRFANNSAFDTQGIKQITFSTWPNSHGFEAQPITVVVEETFQNKPQIVAFAQCALVLLTECAICDSSKHGRSTVPHSHHRWYAGIDFDAKHVNSRTVPQRDGYKELLAKYNPFLDRNKEEWGKLNNHFVHIKAFGVDKHHRHKGLGSFMMNNLMHMFPFSTMFGLEVEGNNHNAVRLYTKMGFGVKRIVNDYYGRGREAYKMIMIQPYNVKQSLSYLKEHRSILRPQNAGDHRVQMEAKHSKPRVLYQQPDDECVCIIRPMDTYVDGMSVERLLKDKQSWKYWPFIDSEHGFVVERVKVEGTDGKRSVIGYIGYQKVDVMNVNSVPGVGWTMNDFVLDEKEDESCSDMTYISQLCVDYRYQHHGVGSRLLSYFVESFPNKTRFGAEIETTNECAMKLFMKVGFSIRRTVVGFYDFGRNAYKMTYILDGNGDTESKRLQDKFKCLLKEKESHKCITKALQDLCGDHWCLYLDNFKEQEVFDADVHDLSEDDLKCLITKMGPRSRFRKWIKERKGKK
eukprot:945851_1